jgi:hypothetical protein
MFARVLTLMSILMMLLQITNSYAQPPDTAWTRTYGGTNVDLAVGAFQIPGEGFIIGGQSNSFFGDDYDYLVVKTDLLGDTLWTRVFGEEGLDETPQCIQPTFDGGCIMAGAKSNEYDLRDTYVVKIRADGELDWEIVMGEDTLDEVGSWIQQTDDGSFILTGSFISSETSGDIFVTKLDSLGSILWNKIYAWSNGDFASCIQQTDDGGYILTGLSVSVNPHEDDMLLFKLDSNGDSVWVSTYGGPLEDRGTCVRQVINEGYIIAGITLSYGAGLYDIYIVKTDLAGNLQWERTFGGPDFDGGRYVDITTDGDYVITGYTTESGAPDIITIKLNPEGDSLWVSQLESEGYDFAASIQQSNDGSYTIGASTDMAGAGSLDFWLIKLDSETGIPINNDSSVPRSFSPSDNYPNPFNATTVIRFSLPQPALVRIEIFDILGRRVDTIIKERQPAGFHCFVWNGSEMSAGIYLYKIQAGDYAESRKMVLLK